MKPPRGEMIWVTIIGSNHEPAYIITSKTGNRSAYYLYSISDDESLKKIGRATSPADLENKYIKY